MKKILASALALLLLLGCTSCVTPPEGEETIPSDEVVTIPPVEIPDLTDERVPTDTTAYAERVSGLFAETETAPETDFTYEIEADGATITGYTGGEIILVIPDTVEDVPVVAIGEGAFRDMSGLKAVSVPDTVRVIGIGAFEGCKGMTTLRTPVYTCHTAPYFGALFGATSHESNGALVPTGLTTLVLTGGESIPDYAFYACRSLEVVALPATLTEIGDFAFYGCERMAYLEADESPLTRVGAMAFANCAALLSLELPASVQTLGAALFEGCGKLETLTLPFVGGCRPDYAVTEEESAAVEAGDLRDPLSTTYLGYLFGADDYAFTAGYLPASLITVTLLEGCGDLPANAFFECASVREVILPEGVKTVGHRAFYGCSSLSAITLPDTVTAIGDDAFHGCIRLVELNVGAGLTTLGIQVFMDCVSLTTVTLPEGVTHLPNAVFAGCVSLESLTAPGVKTQGKQVFRHCDKLTGWTAGSPSASTN